MKSYNPIETLASSIAHAAYEGFPEFEYEDRDYSQGYQPGVEPKYITKKRKHIPQDLTVYSMFEQTWGSTALGFGGIGGQAFTSAYVCVIKSDRSGEYCVYFSGRFAYRITNPNKKFFEDVANQTMLDVKDRSKYNE